MRGFDEYAWLEGGEQPFLQDFGPSTVQLWRPNDFAFHARAYKLAADELVLSAFRQGRIREELVYPIVFLYRHSVELNLKDVLTYGRALIGRPMTSADFHHRLNALWAVAREIIASQQPSSDPATIALEDCIGQFEQFDRTSFAFRYHITKEGTEALHEDMQRINLENLYQIMEKIQHYFDGTLAWLEELRSSGPSDYE